MADQSDVTMEEIHAAVDLALAHVLPGAGRENQHLVRAVVAERIGAAAEHVAKDEVAAARLHDATWDEVAHAFGISPHDAEQRFRTAPMGLPQ